jgi:hypothetical protein
VLRAETAAIVASAFTISAWFYKVCATCG